ncbi:MAG: methylmalonyl-CoA epimerase [Ignavibacteriaceae bacterium]|jgi:methylmalonyl-CoA/ethylmalonyl-CoA epimerase
MNRINKIEHIGIAVKNLADTISYYENILGLKCYAIEEITDQKVKTAFFMVGDVKLELLEATSEDSPIAKFIREKGEGVHHLAFAVNGLNSILPELESKGVQLIDKQPRKGAEEMNIAFLHPKSTFGVLTELCEKENHSEKERKNIF